MNKKVIMAIALIAVMMLTAPLVPIALAKKVIETDMGSYTEYIGSLDGAGFAFLKPKTWNGRLIIGCHWFMNENTWSNNPKETGMMMRCYGWARTQASKGYAFAYSTNGEPNYCIKKGMIRTHQLTEWLIDNYEISDEIYLWGISMGGNIAVLLAEKYPDLYDGVLDVVGVKDMKIRYNSWIGLPDPNGVLPALRAECGGTPEEKPKAYEKRSPTYNAGIKIPVISLHGTADTSVSPIQVELFYDAVEAAGSSDYYKFYMYPGYGHHSFGGKPEVSLHFMDLVNWVENGVEPPSDPYIP
jgi:pimeloyl-ACP methyl ester carboxylesterase